MPRANRYIAPGHIYQLTHRCGQTVVACSGIDEFRTRFNRASEDAIVNDELKRQGKWTETIAVGDPVIAEANEQRIS